MEENQMTQEMQATNEMESDNLEEPVKKLQKGWIKAILFALVLIVLCLGVQIIMGVLIGVVEMAKLAISSGGDVEQITEAYQTHIMESGILNYVAVLGTLINAIIFGIWYKCKYAKKYTREQFHRTAQKAFTVQKLLFTVLLAITCYIVAINLAIILDYISSDTVDNYITLAQEAFKKGPLTIIMSVILAPIGEECMIRGLIQRKLERYLPLAGVLITGVICFSILHGNIVQGLCVIPLGLVTGYYSYYYRSVLPAILFHALYNAAPNLLTLVPDQIADQDWIWHVSAVVLVMIVFILWRLLKKGEQENVIES